MEQEILLAAADYEIYDPYEKRYHHLFDLEAFNLTLNLTESSDRGTLMGGAQENPFSSASFICSIAMIVVACTGTIANSITAYVFSRPTMTSSISILLSGLALVDACVLLTAGPIFAANALFTYWQTFTLMNFVSYSTVYLYPLASIFQTASVWILTLISSERFVAVFRPLVARTRCTRRRARLAVAAVLLCSLAYNVVRFWDYTVFKIIVAEADVSNATQENYSVVFAWPMLRNNKEYVRVYVHWLYFVFIFALPFSALLIFNGLVSYTIRQARKQRLLLSRRQSKEHQTAAMMTIVVLVFLMCNSLAFVLNALEVFGVSGDNEDASGGSLMPLQGGALKPRHSHLFYFLIDANNLLIMVHCSFNFFIYYHFNQRFRLYIAIRLRCIKHNFDSRWRGCCFRNWKADDDPRAENEEAAALDEIGLELLRLKRDVSSRTMVSYLNRVSTREYEHGANRKRATHRIPSVSFADEPSVPRRCYSRAPRANSSRTSLSVSGYREEYCSSFIMDEDSRSANVNSISAEHHADR